MQNGYFYPWRSSVASGNGADAFLEVVERHVSSQSDVLDVGCGHGEFTLAIAPLCRTIVGYDRVGSFIDIACASLRQRGADNVRFVCFDSHANANGGRVHVPAADSSIDVVVSRRGPTHWIGDVRRFCRTGATLLQLNPLEPIAEPEWNRDLPSSIRMPMLNPRADRNIRDTIESRLALVNLHLHSAWSFDVPEWFAAARDLYTCLTFGEDPLDVPAWSDVQTDLDRLFEKHAGPNGLEHRQRTFLWKSIVE